MESINVAAIDLGAESGRVCLARFDGAQVRLDDVHRFPNTPVWVRGHLYWNVLSLWQEILVGLRRARVAAGTLHSIGIDTWAVDYGLVDDQGTLLGLPMHYRDIRTAGVMDDITRQLSHETIYQRTGIQFLPFNTIYQLTAQRRQQPRLLFSSQRFLLMPDLLHSWLSGIAVSERTNATTTQLWDDTEHAWASELFTSIGVPSHLAPPVVEPGTRLGPLLATVADTIGGQASVIAPATHDTGAAIAAIPATTKDGWAYISSGTWSLVGLELPHPIVTSASLAANFTNEGGVFGTTRFLRNVMGLWLLQECQRAWEQAGRSYSYDTLRALATAAPSSAAWIDPDDPRFLAPGDMPTRIQAYLAEHEQTALTSDGSIVRCILESLVLRYRQVLEVAATLAQTPIRVIHIVGGGAKNDLLNQWLADATGIPVIAGPYEATALGNALMQLVGLGELHTLGDIRAIAASGAAGATFSPDASARAHWDEAYHYFHRLTQKGA